MNQVVVEERNRAAGLVDGKRRRECSQRVDNGGWTVGVHSLDIEERGIQWRVFGDGEDCRERGDENGGFIIHVENIDDELQIFSGGVDSDAPLDGEVVAGDLFVVDGAKDVENIALDEKGGADIA